MCLWCNASTRRGNGQLGSVRLFSQQQLLPALLCDSGLLTNVAGARKSENALRAPELLLQLGPASNSHPRISRPGASDAVGCWQLTLLFTPTFQERFVGVAAQFGCPGQSRAVPAADLGP